MSTPTSVVHNGATYEPRATLRHPDGSLSVRYVRTGPAPVARRSLFNRLAGAALSFFV